ncbi:hypothetical protein [Chitinimonas lacunae]|uniref:Ferritin-like domain-containing protein n=1 Tax=Chitinimonas lacunae TaxID=1963018 RepID=A0ABV8MN49_9NEIS
MKLETPSDSDAPPVLHEATSVMTLHPGDCGVEQWMRQFAPVQAARFRCGQPVPPWLREDGPLRRALVRELSFRAYAKDLAAHSLCHLAALAPNTEEREYFVTYLVDETRHAAGFRQRLIDLAGPVDELTTLQSEAAGNDRNQVLFPLDIWSREILEGRLDYLGGVAMVALLFDAVLSPLDGFGESTWHSFDPVSADLLGSADRAQTRHLAVCANILRAHLLHHPQDWPTLARFVADGLTRCRELPVAALMLERAAQYQLGLDSHRYCLGEAEFEFGLRLADSSPAQRVALALERADTALTSRLTHIGLITAMRPN